MKYKITRKLVLYFTSVILLFSLVVGGAFLLLFTRHTEQIYRADMQERAEAIAAGVLSAEPAEVLQKAVNICLECIGVG